jgi:methionyl-tRNA formyltransferase
LISEPLTKTIILTTETTHHLYYVWKLQALCPLDAIILETHSLQAGFETTHPFEHDRDEYEKNEVLKGAPEKIQEILPVHSYSSVNKKESLSKIKELNPDIIIILGTRKVNPAVIGLARKVCLNLHGGAPEYYRGLDSHLWAIYHNDFNKIVTTLHFVETELDAGKIVFEEQLAISKQTTLEKLRILNTVACIRMSALAINSLTENSYIPSRSQFQRGRYYSFMPRELKDVCECKYNRHLQLMK